MDRPEPREAAVLTAGLVKCFGRETALAGVDLAVPEGGVYLLAGTNGAGKSTLLRTLMNVERPDSGSATVLGLDTRANGPEVRARCGYVPETGEATYRWMRAGRFLAYQASFYPAWDPSYADHLARLLDVRMESRLGALSKGQARRGPIVAAPAPPPPPLLLHELTARLPPPAPPGGLRPLAPRPPAAAPAPRRAHRRPRSARPRGSARASRRPPRRYRRHRHPLHPSGRRGGDAGRSCRRAPLGTADRSGARRPAARWASALPDR